MEVEIYSYKCDTDHRFERPFLNRGLICPECGELCTVESAEEFSLGLTLMNGQYPSFRKRYLGTAPHTSNITGLEGKGGPGAKDHRAYVEGQKWLNSIA